MESVVVKQAGYGGRKSVSASLTVAITGRASCCLS